MKPSEIRSKLLEQHAQIRALVAEARGAMDRPAGDRGASAEAGSLRQPGAQSAVMARLAQLLRTHNQEEERLLRDIVARVDAWGPARVEIMDEHHLREHAELYAALFGAEAVALDARRVDGVLDRLLEHMAAEERALYGEDVLRDDSVVIDATCS
ncbi:MAG TPA: hemerythrin domain-containing protein [Polyangiaceae bacterium]|nr:hemerythrin domain-containing protein [Polyangiaceae bacterium]